MSVQAAALYALVGVTGAQQSVRDLQSVSNQVNKTQGVLGQLGKNAGQIGHGMVQVGSGLVRVAEIAGAAALAAVGASAKVGTSFQAQMELIHTQAGATQAEVDAQVKAVEALVHTVGTTPDELAKGLYHIESVGVRGAAALDILKASAIGAKVGLADMDSVTNALTAVWFSGIKGAKSMTDAMAILDGVVGVGNMHLQDLTDSFKSGILGTAATFGVDIRSLGAAIATLTDAGVPANIAATRLNMTLSHMAAPVPKAIDTLKALGIGQFDLANDLRKPDGIFVALQDLHDHLAKAGDIKNGLLTPAGADALTKIFGGSRFGATAMQLLTQMDRVDQKYGLITQRSQTFADNVKATMETAGFKFGVFKADIQEAALAFSEGFLPALARAGTRLDSFLLGHMGDIRTLGVQLGGWLDKINWQQAEDGANNFLGVLKSALDVISKIPPEIDAAIVGFLAINKLSGGLVGRGLEDIAGGVLGGLGTIGKAGLRGLLGKIPVIGGAAAALTSTPVFVTNWPLGFGGAGAGGVGLAEGAGAAAAGLGLGTIAVGVAAGTAVAALGIMGLGWLITATSSPEQLAQAAANVNADQRYKRSLGGISGSNAGGPAASHDRGYDVTMPTDYSAFANANAREDRATIKDAASAMKDTLSGLAKMQTVVLDKIHQNFVDAIHGLKKADQTPAQIQKMTKQIVDAALKGVGSTEHTREAIDLLRAKLSGADRETAKVIRAAIAAIEPKLANRQFVDRQLAAADASLLKNESIDAHVRDLTRIQRTLLNNGDTKAAGKITAEIRAEKAKLAAATAHAASTMAGAISSHPPTLTLFQTLKLLMDGREISSTVLRQEQFGRHGPGID